jgi:hypothetical protein
VRPFSQRHIGLILTSTETPPLRLGKAFYIKLGKGGSWEADSIGRGIMRIGWPHNPLADVNAHNWEAVRGQIQHEQPHRGTSTRDVNALREIVVSTEVDIWITFHRSRLWWCRLAEGPVEEDETSKFRRVRGAWSDRAADGRVLVTADIPGVLSQLQGFRGTVCSVRAVESLGRLLNAQSSSPMKP